jgi:hypothetical protein
LLRLEVGIQDDRDLLHGETVSAANFSVTVSSSFLGGTVYWHSLGSQEMQQVYRREEDRSTLFASCRSSSLEYQVFGERELHVRISQAHHTIGS